MRLMRGSLLPLRTVPGRTWRRRIGLAAGVGAILAALGGGAWIERTGRLDADETYVVRHVAEAGARLGLIVDNVSVEGRKRVGRQAILDALAVRRGTPILAVDLAAAKARLEALTWVRTADVQRILPDTLFVRLLERQPLAYWQRQGKLVLIDRDGAVIPTDHLDAFGPLIVLVGDDAPKLAASLLGMLATEPDLASHVAAAVRVGDRRWNLRLDNGIDVKLPEQDAEGAWHRLAALDRSENLLERVIAAVDLRLPDRLVVRLPPEPAKPAPPKKGKTQGKST